ncbi:15587_t:CDS:2 [Funneliformis geosporum]|uniref:15587_t:CDS:1 n=1 Tax=Funneliformis geosporum TaxID=1117311 RepID=A0A9W4SAC7_9GLOM|nr:15587_t:CDS:2 [Funneliformis geosporum]
MVTIFYQVFGREVNKVKLEKENDLMDLRKAIKAEEQLTEASIDTSTRKLTFTEIKEILDKYVNKCKNSRKSLSNSENIPDDTEDISTYLKFVNHKYHGVVRPEIAVVVKNCIYAGRSFRVACDSFTIYEFKEEPESLLIFKEQKFQNMRIFVKNFKEHFIALNEILDVILSYFPNTDKSSDLPLIIINIDETNSIFEQNRDKFLKGVVKSLSDRIFQHYFIFPVLTGTHASNLFNTVKSTNAKFI